METRVVIHTQCFTIYVSTTYYISKDRIFAISHKFGIVFPRLFADCCTRMTDEALLALATSQSQSLVRLQLRDCIGLRDVSCLFEQFRHLREIDLSGCVALHQPSSFSSQNTSNDSTSNMLSCMSKIVLPKHLHQSFESIMEPHLIANVTYDNEVRREEEEVNELEYLTPVCIKF